MRYTYKKHPSLWNVKSAEYINRNLKEKGYNELQELYEKYNIANCTVETVKKKIQSLRAAFRRELKKFKQAKKSGAGTDEVENQQPTLWYFPLLMFTADNEESRESTSNVQMKEVSDEEVRVFKSR